MPRLTTVLAGLLVLASAACGGSPAPRQDRRQDQDIPDVSMGLFNPGGNHVTYDCSNGSKLTLVFGTPETGGLLEEVHLSSGATRRGYHFNRFLKDKKPTFEVTEMTEEQKLLRHTLEIASSTACILKFAGETEGASVRLEVIPAPNQPNASLFTATVGDTRIMQMGIGQAIPKIEPYFLAVFFLMGQWARYDLAIGSIVMNWLGGLGLSTMSIADEKGQIDLVPNSRTETDENGVERSVFYRLQKNQAGKLEQSAVFWRRDDGQIQKIELSSATSARKVLWTRSTLQPWTVEQGRLVLRSLDIVLGWDPDEAEQKRLQQLGSTFAGCLFEAFDGQASVKEIIFYPKKVGRNPTQPGVIWIGKTLEDVKIVDPYYKYCLESDPKRAGVLAYTYASNPLHGNPMFTALDKLDLARKANPVGDGVVLLHEFMHSYWGLDEEYANAKGDGPGNCPMTTSDRSTYKCCVMDNKLQPELCRGKYHSSDTRQQKVRGMDCTSYVTQQAAKYLKFELSFKTPPSLGDIKRAPDVKITFK